MVAEAWILLGMLVLRGIDSISVYFVSGMDDVLNGFGKYVLPFHLRGGVHRGTKQLETRPLSTEDARRARSRVKPEPNHQITSVWSEIHFQLFDDNVETIHTLPCKASGDFGVSVLWVRESNHSDV